MIPPDERADYIAQAVSAFRSAQIGPTRFRALLAIAGLNASDIDALVKEHDDTNTKAIGRRCG